MVRKHYFALIAISAVLTLIRVDKRELRKGDRVNSFLLQGGLLPTESLMVSESSKGLQRAGVSNHLLARECVTLSFFTGLDRGVAGCGVCMRHCQPH